MKKLISTLIILTVTASAPAATIYVDANGAGDYPTIQDAINDANDGDEILVAPGIYRGEGNRDIDYKGKSITVRSTDPNDSNVVENTIIDCNGSKAEEHRGFYFHSGENEDSVLKGITITKGYSYFYGSGIYFQGSSPTIKDCIIKNNLSPDGGCLYLSKSKAQINNCILISNIVVAGIWSWDGAPNIIGCIVSKTGGNGNGIICHNGGRIINCIANDNENGIYCSKGIINNCVSVKNRNGIVCGNKTSIRNCLSRNNKGAGVSISGNNVEIFNCLITGNKGMGVGNSYSKNARIINCTIIGNSGSAGGGVYCNGSTMTLVNSILKNKENNGSEIYIGGNMYWHGNITILYNDIKGGEQSVKIGSYGNLDWKLGNIDEDPCFIEPGYWDPNGTPNDTSDDFWVDGDYHLLSDSLCINTGDPNYIPEPNETDLDGLPRVIGGRIDMGAYEYQNTQPIANAGPNQVDYAFLNGLADVTLDGSASYDDDNDPLDYYWSWNIDGNLYEANGISPCITLPVGQHQIELIVNDGFDDSEPDYCTVTVIEPLETRLWLWPGTLNCNSGTRYVTAMMHLPKSIEPGDVDSQPLIMYPCNIQSKYQRVFRTGYGRGARTIVMAVFDKDQICDYFGTGWHKVEVAGRLQSGRYFYGTGTINIIKPRFHHWPLRRFYRPH